ncbi:MAG: GNAT family N-acetyltransferase [Cryobacterium sp.]|nr:GNAT family N-acetyltransferase [Oligoflexia bacterium]
MLITTAKLTDAEAVTRLVNSAYRGEASRAGWTTEADLIGGQRTDVERIFEMIEDSDASLQIAWLDGELVACVLLKRENESTGYLGMLSVDPTLQAAGVGKKLIAHSEALVKSWGCRSMRLIILQARTDLAAYYERRGYRKTGFSEPFPGTDPRFGVPKVEGLRLEEMRKHLD